ncbi:hypothetical protein [Arthrobacter sp. USHLN218]|uniref:hypothetical protein n=1 Tax=Arthrobacter sp. USHLN218 TaxID=3081232 RepID=UPI00301B3861
MSQIATAEPELHVVTNVTGWSQTRVNRLLEAIKSLEVDIESVPLDEVEATGWTTTLVEKVFELLTNSRAIVQIKAVKFAIEHGGVVNRDDVYELGGYSESRSLKGFTRPTNRATQTLRDSGDLPEDAEELLEPIYDMNVRGYQRAKGFRVPLEIVRLFSLI